MLEKSYNSGYLSSEPHQILLWLQRRQRGWTPNEQPPELEGGDRHKGRQLHILYFSRQGTTIQKSLRFHRGVHLFRSIQNKPYRYCRLFKQNWDNELIRTEVAGNLFLVQYYYVIAWNSSLTEDGALQRGRNIKEIVKEINMMPCEPEDLVNTDRESLRIKIRTVMYTLPEIEQLLAK